MSPSLIARAVLGAVAVLVAVLVIGGGDDPYVAKLRMANAGGLKNGSPVTTGGVRIGKVHMEPDTAGRVAKVELRIEDEYAPLGRGASAAIVAQNLLGQKQVQVTPGNRADAAPSGFVIPERRITQPTDLDRVLNVLDGDTRARLAIFVNEAGAAFTGRRADFNRFLRDIAPAVASGTDVVRQLGADNRRLRRLLTTSDRYVAEVTRRRKDAVRLVDRVGEAAETASGKRVQLRQTIAAAPGALRSLRGLLAELRVTSAPLGAAARQVSNTTAPLQQALEAIEPFRQSAAPALRSARDIAPDLERLALRATPVIRRAVPTARAVRRMSADDLPAVTATTDRSINNTLATVQNWAGAIQFRDGLSHIFRGEASFAPDGIKSLVERLSPSAKKKSAGGRRGDALSPAPTPAPAAPATPAPTPKRPLLELPTIKLPKLPPLPSLPQLLEQVPAAGETVKGLTNELKDLLHDLAAPGSADGSDDRGVTSLLDFLLR